MISVGLSAEGRKFARELAKRIDPARSPEFMNGLGRIAQLAAQHVVRTQLSGTKVKRRTGNLARSVVGVSAVVGGVPAIRVGILRGPALAYAGILEYGTKDKNPASPYARIEPRVAKLLAQPVGKALTPAGAPRWRGPRTYPGSLSFVPFPKARASGSPVVAGLFNKNELAKKGLGGADALFLLRRWTSVEPRRYLLDGVTDFVPEIRREVEPLLMRLLFGSAAA